MSDEELKDGIGQKLIEAAERAKTAAMTFAPPRDYTDEEHAKKIAADIFAKWKAEKEGIM